MNQRHVFDNPNYKGSNKLKGKVTIINFTRNISTNLADKNIRVNAAAPGYF